MEVEHNLRSQSSAIHADRTMKSCANLFAVPLLFSVLGIGSASRVHRDEFLLARVTDSFWPWPDRDAKVDNTTISPKIQYISEKMAIERSVVGQFAAEPADTATVSGVPKVAFLFMTMTGLQWPSLWDRFFADAMPDHYSIYVHRAALKDDAAGKPPLPLAQWGATAVPWVRTAWCALFGVEVAMLSAALKDLANAQFVFVSDSTVPLKNFGYVYRQLAELSPTTSKFCLAEAAKHDWISSEMTMQETKQACVFRDFLRRHNPRTLKHHQWAVLARSHASVVVQRASIALDIYENSWSRAAPDMTQLAEGCSDEAVPLIALLHDIEVSGKTTGNTWADLTRMGVEQQCLTYVRWRNCFAGTALNLASRSADFSTLFKHSGEAFRMLLLNVGLEDILNSKLKRDLNGFPHVFEEVDLHYLKLMVHEGFMFARKFTNNANVTTKDGPVPLTELLPSLWDEVDEGYAQKKVWSYLEKAGKPGALNKP